jgi:hypothetical protein
MALVPLIYSASFEDSIDYLILNCSHLDQSR